MDGAKGEGIGDNVHRGEECTCKSAVKNKGGERTQPKQANTKMCGEKVPAGQSCASPHGELGAARRESVHRGGARDRAEERGP